jgi:hypothetical protein
MSRMRRLAAVLVVHPGDFDDVFDPHRHNEHIFPDHILPPTRAALVEGMIDVSRDDLSARLEALIAV